MNVWNWLAPEKPSDTARPTKSPRLRSAVNAATEPAMRTALMGKMAVNTNDAAVMPVAKTGNPGAYVNSTMAIALKEDALAARAQMPRRPTRPAHTAANRATAIDAVAATPTGSAGESSTVG